MEKQLAIVAYWIGILSTAIAVITRGLAIVGIFVWRTVVVGQGNPVSYRSFFEAASLFFVMASAVIAFAKERKAQKTN
jgi:hypothetical protein